MNGKRLFWYSMGLKLMIIFFVISLAWGHKLISQKWFDPTVSESDKIFAVQRKEGNINARNEFGLTGLMVATQTADVELFKALLIAGADATLESYDRPSAGGKTIPANMRKVTVIHIAVQSADYNPKAQLEILTFLFHFLKTRNKEGRGNVNIASLVNKKNAAGNTAAHDIPLITLADIRIAFLNLLLDNGLDLNAQNFEGDTWLFVAVRRNDRPLVKYALPNDRIKKLTDKNIRNKKGYTLKGLAKALNLRDMLALICSFHMFPCEGDEFRGIDTPQG